MLRRGAFIQGKTESEKEFTAFLVIFLPTLTAVEFEYNFCTSTFRAANVDDWQTLEIG
jgi:hypothetical protein